VAVPKKITEPYVQWKISVPGTLAARVEMLLFDPTHQKPGYAKRSQLITDLLSRWIAEQTGERASAR
jgi:metal-responsive CopG/Arc/MetJ family transcriptional regulator